MVAIIITFFCVLPLFIIGYQLAFKGNYYLYTSQGFSAYKKKYNTYPVEIKKEYCKYCGYGLIFLGFVNLLIPFLSDYSILGPIYFALNGLCILYLLFAPRYIVEKKNKKI